MKKKKKKTDRDAQTSKTKPSLSLLENLELLISLFVFVFQQSCPSHFVCSLEDMNYWVDNYAAVKKVSFMKRLPFWITIMYNLKLNVESLIFPIVPLVKGQII